MTSRSVFPVGLTAMLCAACFKPSGNDNDTDGGTGSDGGSTGTSASTASSTSAGSTTASSTDGTQSTTASTSATTAGSTGENDTTSTDPDDSGTATSAATGESTGGAAECGNGVVEAGEGCDDGVNAGEQPGDCAPDCSKVVVVKEIVHSADGTFADIANLGPGSVIENLDGLCPFGYSAMFSDGVDRIATVTANTGDGQVDWVLDSWTAYVNSDGDLLAITDGAALLGVHDGTFTPLANAITPGDNGGTYTGLNQDWTALEANENCNNWTNATNNYQMMMGSAGMTSAAFLRQSQAFTYPCSDAFERPIYCAEQ